MKPRNYVAVTVAGFRSDSEIWQEVNRKAAELKIDEPTLPRRTKAPKRFDQANATTHADHTPEDWQYFEVVDTLTGEIERRFQSESFVLYTKIAICSQRRTRLTSRSS